MLLQQNLILHRNTTAQEATGARGAEKDLGIAVGNDRTQRRYSMLLAGLKG